MKNNDLEKNIRDQLGSYENFDGDKMAMWNEIEQELDHKKKRGFFWIWFGTGVLILGLAITFFFFGENKKSQLAKSEIPSLSNFQKPPAIKTKDSVSIDLTNDKAILSKTTANLENKNPATNFSTPKKQPTITKTTTGLNNKKVTTTLIEKQISPTEDATSSIATVDQEIEAVKTKTTISSKEAFNFLPPLYLALDLKKNDILELDLDTLFIPKDDSDDKKLWALNFSGGLLTNTTGYNNSSTFSSLRKNSNSPGLGWSFQMELERLLPKDFYLATGIHFNRHWMEFDYTSTTTETQYLENVIIRFDVDLAVGDTTIIYGDTSISSITTRDVKHHNRYDKLTIPILLGKRWTKGKFSYGLFAGVGLDIWLRQKGRNLSINPEEFVFDYDSKNQNDQNGFPKLGISAHFKGVVNYSIGKNSSLFIQPNVNLSLKDWSPSNNGIKQKPITFGINLGYQFKF